jgi:tRNA A37 threonylcarbamoyladenosine biosynthesis protein TsaE
VLAGVAIDVPSPTFTLVQDYDLPGLTLRHIDLYRITSPDELLELGLETPAADEAWLVEWPDRAGPWLPPDRLDVFMTESPGPTAGDDGDATPGPATARRVRLVAGPSWRARLDRLLQS